MCNLTICKALSNFRTWTIVPCRPVPRGALTCKKWMDLGYGIERAHQRRQVVDKRVDSVQEDA